MWRAFHRWFVRYNLFLSFEIPGSYDTKLLTVPIPGVENFDLWEVLQVLAFYLTLQSGWWLPVFWRNLLPTYSTVKMEAAGFSKMLVTVNQTTWHHISEDDNFICVKHMIFAIVIWSVTWSYWLRLLSVLVICWKSTESVSHVIILFVAMKPHEIQEKLGLTRIRDRNWYVQPSCATTGDGLYEGLTWLTSNHKLWTHQQWLATFRRHAVTRHTIVVIQCILVASLWSEVEVWLCPTWLQVSWGVGNVLQPL
jgi:hypothetical protein